MDKPTKEIRFYGIKPGKSIKRLIERQVEKWLYRKAHLPVDRGDAAFTVWIEREMGNVLSCHVQVQVGSERWESYDVGKSVQDALFHALQHLGKSFRPNRKASTTISANHAFA